jgi:lipoprotein-anchoring transpeptidase ErfK/SrfK
MGLVYMARVLAVFLLAVSSVCSGGANLAVSKPPKARPQPVIHVDEVNNLATMDLIGLNDDGSAVLRAQVLLDRAHFSVGEIDGIFGTNMLNSLNAYQAAHDLPTDGAMNPDTWEALDVDAETLPILVPYTITKKDVAGPFNRIPRDMMEQAKLSRLGYSSPIEELGERFHASIALLQSLNPGKQFGKAGERILVPNIDRTQLPERPALVVVKKDCSCVEALDGANHLMAHYPATMGSSHDPLPVGQMKLAKPRWNPIFFYDSNLFWDAKVKGEKAVIPSGPKNPVGVVWIGLSKAHLGIHGTPTPSTIGRAHSHGCIRLTNWDATELGNIVQAGMTASLRES